MVGDHAEGDGVGEDGLVGAFGVGVNVDIGFAAELF